MQGRRVTGATLLAGAMCTTSFQSVRCALSHTRFAQIMSSRERVSQVTEARKVIYSKLKIRREKLTISSSPNCKTNRRATSCPIGSKSKTEHADRGLIKRNVNVRTADHDLRNAAIQRSHRI